MQSPLLNFAPAPLGGGGDSGCCHLFSKPKPQTYEEQDASLIIERLQQLARAKKHQIVGLKLQQKEAELDALACEAESREHALSFMRIALNYKNEAISEQAKYEQLVKLSNAIESARRNLEMAATMFASSKTLQQVLEAMPVDEMRNVMDELRELFVQHQEQSKELSSAIYKEGGGIRSVILEDELDKMIAERQQERMARLEIETLGQIVKNKREAVKLQVLPN